MPLAALAHRCAALLFGLAALPALAHPLDPLNADEIIGAASILLGGGAAQPGAIFQSVELREPPKAATRRRRARPRCSGARTGRASRPPSTWARVPSRRRH
jgi:Cu2+-containing amine oxidase